MSFRRFVGKTVHITAQGTDGDIVYDARLFDYDDAGIWLHHTDSVDLPGGRTESVDGLLFLPHSRIVNVFAFDGMDEMLADELEQQEQAGVARESAARAAMDQRTPQDRATIDAVGEGLTPEGAG